MAARAPLKSSVDNRVRLKTWAASILKVGHPLFQCEPVNSMADDSSSLATINTAAPGALKSLVERIERLEEDKAAVAADLREVYAEAKGGGFDGKILRKVVRLRAQDAAKRAEEEALIALYISAIGGL